MTQAASTLETDAPQAETQIALPPSPRGPEGFRAVARRTGVTISGDCAVVASYPRSGNKMTRTFLHFYAGNPDPAALERLRADEGRFLDYLGRFKSALVTPKGRVLCHRIAPEDLKDIDLMGRPGVLAKTHAPDWPERCVLKPFVHIYLVRHPLDVLASSLNFLFSRKLAEGFAHSAPKPLDALIESGEIAAYIDDFIAKEGVAHFTPSFGSWLDHVMTWPDRESGAPVACLKYEDVVADPAGQYARAFAAAGAPFDAARAGRALALADQSRGIELKRGGGYLGDVLTPAQKAAAKDAFGPALDRFGYEI
ncbi:MAG: sulfotransferase domain-containing protein [Euryhalocaulis sp.]|uniref:sulfotransferase domain-containing protein n=1 Tax=Euryhalocaulis sp. TaxID=2744307 RepID=UPI0017948A56|nr:sulfotransferase domain-containing protein [Euryhalocaulis sp.]MBA4801416.1 sulfotransferase domain-containing protein [Euryhalocaulis sp.]